MGEFGQDGRMDLELDIFYSGQDAGVSTGLFHQLAASVLLVHDFSSSRIKVSREIVNWLVEA